MQERVGTRPADQRRQRVEVVVVDHHHRVLDALDLLEHRPREVLVDGVVAELERLGLVAADVRRVGEIPQVVLDEPQHRVGDDVVEAVVGLGVGGDELDLVLAAVGGADRERPAVVALGDLDVLVGHRRGDPGHLAVGGQAGQRGDQAAGPALDLAVGLEGHRAAVGDEHERRVGSGHRQRAEPDQATVQALEDLQPVAQQPGHQEPPPGALLAGASEPLAELGIAQDLERALRRTPRRWRRGSRSRRRRPAAGCRRRYRR